MGMIVKCGEIYHIYPQDMCCLPNDEKNTCQCCECFGGYQGNNILCTHLWTQKP